MATTLRNVRVGDELWDAAEAAAARRGTNRSAYLVRKLEELVEADRVQQAFVNGFTATPATDRQELPR